MLAQPVHGRCHLSDILIIEDFSGEAKEKSQRRVDFVLLAAPQATCAVPVGPPVPFSCRLFRWGWWATRQSCFRRKLRNRL